MAKGTVSGVDTQDVLGNVAVGGGAGAGITTGVGNSLIGCQSGDAVTTGKCNVSIGTAALGASTTGCLNIGIGATAMGAAIVTGINNIAVGTTSMDALTSGICNVAIGTNALGASTTGCKNIAIGELAMGAAITTGINNIAVGTTSADALTSGICNVAIGTNALGASTTGCKNIGIGGCAIGAGVFTGNNNVALGNVSGRDATSAADNFIVGNTAGLKITSGASNIIIGLAAADAGVITGNRNIALGQQALKKLTNGLDNIAIGCQAGCSITTQEKIVNIGKGSDEATTCHGCIKVDVLCSASFGTTSDCRAKCSISTSDLGLDFIKALKPVKFKMRDQRDVLDEDGNLIYDPESPRQVNQFSHGLMSQDVMSTIKGLGKEYVDFAGLLDDLQEPYTLNSDGERLIVGTRAQAASEPEKYWGQGLNDYDPDNPDGLYQKTQGLDYTQFVAPLIKAVQEVDAAVIALTARVKALE